MRAPLSSDLLPVQDALTQLLPMLEAEKDWYGSIFFERKSQQSYSANLKQTQMTDQVSMGAVLRIYNGYTLFEQATDDLSPESLKRVAESFVKRVRATPISSGATCRPYRPPTWKDRVAGAKLDDEILSQLPKDAKAATRVHFGIRFQKDPKAPSTAQRLESLKAIVDRCKSLASAVGLKSEDLSFVTARQTFAEEESIFIDRETNMSQSIYRLALTIITMSGADRTYERIGGLGGMEIVEVTDELIRGLLLNLKGLKDADRLKPGKYKVLFGPSISGVLAHEAFGHSQEADTWARGRSKARELYKSGEAAGNEHATILNNPAIFQNGEETYAAWGSYFFDEEGWLAQEQVLLEQGRLMQPMTNLTSAIRLGLPRSANGKRESWANGVYSRQTNTYFSPGDRTLDELLSEMGDGFIAVHSAGGMEDPKGMGIQVGIAFLEEVRDGKRTGKLLKGPAGGDIQMTGYTPDILNSIVAKSRIDAESRGSADARHPYNDAGGCGKYHKEVVFAGCGGPYMLLKDVTLG